MNCTAKRMGDGRARLSIPEWGDGFVLYGTARKSRERLAMVKFSNLLCRNGIERHSDE